MRIEPQADEFARRYNRGEAQVVWSTLVADLETPVCWSRLKAAQSADAIP
jgi:anthranilate synthase component 1